MEIDQNNTLIAYTYEYIYNNIFQLTPKQYHVVVNTVNVRDKFLPATAYFTAITLKINFVKAPNTSTYYN